MHVPSAGVAGTMAAKGSGVQMSTLRNLRLIVERRRPEAVFSA
jgi:hypothetical protein